MNKREEPARNYADLHEHLARLDAAGQLYRIDEPVNKDTELHPLVRWQFRGGIAEKDRKAFLFTNVVDSTGRRYDLPMAVGVFAANPEIYRIGMNVERLDEIGPAWSRAIANPIAPRIVARAPVHDIVVTGEALLTHGLDSLPIPISTPGFDAAFGVAQEGIHGKRAGAVGTSRARRILSPEEKERRRSQHARAHRGGQGQWLKPARRRA